MNRILAERNVYVDLQLEDLKEQSPQTHYKIQYRWIRLFLVSVLLVGMFTVSLFQIRLYSGLIRYQEEIRSLEEVIDSLSTKNEQLSLEIIRLTSPTRLRSEGKRLGLQPSNRIIILPTE